MIPSAHRLLPTDTTIRIDGVVVPARSGESVAAAISSSRQWGPFFCGMGVCFVCAVTVDGMPGCRACLERVRAGMSVELADSEFE